MLAVNASRLPDTAYPNPDVPKFPIVQPGVPLYFLGATAGVLLAMLVPGPIRRFHIAWGLALFGYFFVIMLTANVRPRFRFVFEPFWFLYIAMLGDFALRGLTRIVKR